MQIKLTSYMLAAATAFALMSCKDDLTLGDENNLHAGSEYDGPSLYMALGVNFSDDLATRSSTNTPDDGDYGTSTGGMEYSSLEEYDVRTAIIVLAKMGTYDYLAHADVNGILTSDRNSDYGDAVNGAPIDPSKFFSFTTMGRFKYSQIEALYDDDGNIKDDYKEGVNVFVFCNPTGDLLQRFESTDFSLDPTGWINWSGLVEQEPALPGYTPAVTNSIWAPRSFLMSNAKPAFAELPKKLSNWDYYNQEDPFDLSGKNNKFNNEDPDNSEEGGLSSGKTRGAVFVERAVARIDIRADRAHLEDLQDYKDGLISEEDALWRYPILGGLSSSMHDGTIDSDGKDGLQSSSFNFIDVQLTRLSLVNMSKNFHFLRRTSDDGMPQNSTVMGVERRANYVVDTDAEIKQKLEGYDYDNASNGFNFALFTNGANSTNPELSRAYAYDRNSWFTSNIKDIMSNGKFDNSGESDGNKYNIWRYITENTIPQDEAGGTSRQVAVQSTGLVFKGLILPGKDVDKTYKYTETLGVAEEPVAAADDELRYIPVEVVNALLASKYHLPKSGDGKDDTSTNPVWTPQDDDDMYQKDRGLNDRSKERYSYNYPTLYMFSGSIYAGFKTVVAAAQQYDGPGGLMYQAVNSTLGCWWARLEDLQGMDPETGAPKGIAYFEYKGDSFDPAAEENENYHWLQLTVPIYNKIVNDITDGEPIVEDRSIGFKAMASSFRIKHSDDNPDINDVNESERTFRHLLTEGSDASRFTLYDASYEETDRGGAGWGYYCYYFWWLKHNDNGIDGRMGPMEFGTVRNNVYKVTVDKISSLGHSLNTLNDPEPLTPETPDEDDKIYIDVTMKVVPWVVRHNSAQF